MKVLHVIWDLGQGGAQKYLVDLLIDFSQYDNVESRVLVLGYKGYLSGKIQQVSSNVEYLNMSHGYNPFAIIQLNKYLLRSDVDIIHSHTTNLAFHMLLHFVKTPVVYTEHAGQLLSGRWTIKILYKYLNRPIRSFIAISKYIADVMRNENPAISPLIRIIHNGVDVNAIKKEKKVNILEVEETGSNVKLIGFIGRLISLKGVDYFIEVAKRILMYRKDVKFIIIGEGKMKQELKSLASKYDISSYIKFVGYREDAIGYLKSLDVLLFTSRFDGFGLVLTEAMAAEVPVVAMDIKGAVREIIRPDLDGIVIDGADCEEAAMAVMRLIDDKDLQSKITNNALERVANSFTIEKNTNEVYSVYQQVLENTR